MYEVKGGSRSGSASVHVAAACRALRVELGPSPDPLLRRAVEVRLRGFACLLRSMVEDWPRGSC